MIRGCVGVNIRARRLLGITKLCICNAQISRPQSFYAVITITTAMNSTLRHKQYEFYHYRTSYRLLPVLHITCTTIAW